jgi:hypothetical protein
LQQCVFGPAAQFIPAGKKVIPIGMKSYQIRIFGVKPIYAHHPAHQYKPRWLQCLQQALNDGGRRHIEAQTAPSNRENP